MPWRPLAAAVMAWMAIGIGRVSAHDPLGNVTWNSEIGRLVRERCLSCHTPGGRAPMALASYRDARPWARAIREEVLTRRMPKWQAARGYGQFANDPSLSPFEIALFVKWADGGAPEGKPGAPAGPAPGAGGPTTPDRAASSVDDLSLTCGSHRLPSGTLTAFTPQLAEGASIGLLVALPDGHREIVGWIRGFDSRFPVTYRLATPIRLGDGARLETESSGGDCTVRVSVAR